MSLSYSALCSKHVAALRHAPVLGATFVIPPPPPQHSAGGFSSRQEDFKSKALLKAAKADSSAPRPSSSFTGQLRQPKRQSSGGDKVHCPNDLAC